MSKEMDLSSMTKPKLHELCKESKLRNYSKYAKPKLIELLEENGYKNVAENNDKKKSKTVTSKPRFMGLSTKLERYINCDDFKTELLSLGEDASDDKIIEIFKSKIDEFITSEDLTPEDYKKYINKHGDITVLLELNNSRPKFKLSNYSEDELYKELAIFKFKTDDTININIVKKAKKSIIKYNKELAADNKSDKSDKKTSNKSTKKSKTTTKSSSKPEEEEEEKDELEEEEEEEEEE